MPDYTRLSIGPSNAVVECDIIDVANSADAMRRTKHALGNSSGLTAIEIWREGRIETKLTLTDFAEPGRH